MRTIFYFNSDFELRLLNKNVPVKLSRIIDEIALSILPILNRYERLLSDIDITNDYYDYLKTFLSNEFGTTINHNDENIFEYIGDAWGWNADTIILFNKLDLYYSKSINLENIKNLNSREFSYNISKLINYPIPETSIISSFGELKKIVNTSNYSNFVLKPLFGQAGNGFIKGTKDTLLDIKERVLLNKSYIFEPWLNRIEDFSQLIRVNNNGEIDYHKRHYNICNKAGMFIGIMISPNSSYEKLFSNELDEIAEIVGSSLAKNSYIGYTSIDAFSYLGNDGEISLASGFDINVRYSISYLAHQLYKKLNLTNETLLFKYYTKKDLKLPADYQNLYASLGDLSYKDKRGVIFITPIKIKHSDTSWREPNKFAIAIIAESKKKVESIDSTLKNIFS